MISSMDIRSRGARRSSRATQPQDLSCTRLFVALTIALILNLLNPVQTLQLSNSPNPNMSEQISSGLRPANPLTCAKNWMMIGQKCYRVFPSPKNYEAAKSRCNEFLAQLALIEDESTNKEKEGSSASTESPPVNLIAYLSSDPNAIDHQPKQYYVALAQDLLNQHFERQRDRIGRDGGLTDAFDPDMAVSELWFNVGRDDPTLLNLSNGLTEPHDRSNTSFVLAYSKVFKRWGIIPVLSTRRFPFICARQISSTLSNSNSTNSSKPNDTSQFFGLAKPPSDKLENTSMQHQNIEPKRVADSGGRTASLSFNFAINRQPLDSLTTPSEPRQMSGFTPSPEPVGMIFRDIPQDQNVIMGSKAELRCSALDSDSILSWSFNNESLTPSNRLKLSPVGFLKIEHVRNTDAGLYTCTINSGGSIEAKNARLNILERPHPPEYITAELMDKLSTSVRVKWSPGYNGNSPITRYQIEMLTVETDNIDKDLNTIMQSELWKMAKSDVSADLLSTEVSDLKPAKKYIFRIKATNRIGTSDPSLPTMKPVDIPVQAPSKPPENLVATPKSSTSIALQWSPPPVDSQNGILKGYKIRHKLAGYVTDSDWLTTDVPDAAHLTYILEDLIVWQNYEIQVAAENEKGHGPFTSSQTARTKEGKPTKGPRSVKAEADSSTKISIRWLPPIPQFINGLNQGYKVQLWLDTSNSEPVREITVPHNLASREQSTVVDGLIPYTEYSITVKCFTNAGDGPSNEEVATVRTEQDLPEVVSSLEFAEVLDKSLRLIWKPPRRANGELESYLLEYSQSSMTEKKIHRRFPPTMTEALITDLTPQTSYTFELSAHNKVGSGPRKMNQTKTSVPPVIPEPTINLTSTSIASTSVTISFKPNLTLEGVPSSGPTKYTHDSESRANQPFHKESWFVIACACTSIVITIIITALLFVQTKSYKYKRDATKSTSHDRLGDAGFTIDDDPGGHYNNGFGLLNNTANHRRSNGSLSQSTANFTLPKTPPRPHPGSVAYSDDDIEAGDDEVFEDVIDKRSKMTNDAHDYDSSGDSLTEKPSEISSSPAPESESADDEYVNMASKHFVNHYGHMVNLNGGRIIVNNMAGSRAPLPGFTSFVKD